MKNIALILCLFVIVGCSKNEAPTHKEIVKKIKEAEPIQVNEVSSKLLPSENEIVSECEDILQRLQDHGVKKAFEKIRLLSPLSETELNEMEQKTSEQLDAIKPRFGAVIGFEKIRIEKKGESVLECVYITKMENHILRWRFYFYRPKEKWFLNSFTWDDQIQGL